MDIRPIDVQLTINQASNISKAENKDIAFTQNNLMQMHTYEEKVLEESQRTATFSDVNNKTISDKEESQKKQQEKRSRKRRARVEEKREKQKKEYSKMSVLDVTI